MLTCSHNSTGTLKHRQYAVDRYDGQRKRGTNTRSISHQRCPCPLPYSKT